MAGKPEVTDLFLTCPFRQGDKLKVNFKVFDVAETHQ